MKNNKYNSGEIFVGFDAKNGFVSTSFLDDVKKSSIAVIASILVLTLITCTFFAVFGDFEQSVPAGNFETTTTTTTTTTTNNSQTQDPDTNHPYATVTDRTNFIASRGGDDLGNVYLYSEYAILIRLSDMTTIAHQNADTKMYPASMTKVMTVVTALDLIENLDDEYLITNEILSTVPDGASTAWLSSYVGNKVSVLDLLYGISYRSGADSVLCLLDYLGLSTQQFVTYMNQKAAEIGLQNTIFGGAIGMDSEENQTTCRDMAAIMAYAMENPLCHDLFGATAYRLKYIEMTYYNATLTNTLDNMGTKPSYVLGKDYTLLAAKSGLEENAGYCLVSYIKNDVTGETFVLVTANANRAAEYPYNKNPILDMEILFEEFNP